MLLRRGGHAVGCLGGQGGRRGWRNTQREIAAAVESVYRMDLKRPDPDLGLLGGDNEGGGVQRGGSAPASRSSTTGGLPEGNPARAECENHQNAREDKASQDRHEDRPHWRRRRGPAIRPPPAHGRGESEGEEVR